MDTAQTINMLWMMVCAILVIIMQAGFCSLESGSVRSKNSINVAIKNLIDVCITALAYWAVGFGLMFGSSKLGLVGTDHFLLNSFGDGQTYAFFFFQIVFCSTTATIVSGAVAERLRFSRYIVITLIMAVIIYPVLGHWFWGGLLTGESTGWMAKLGFIDFAGSTVVHSIGGWMAFSAAIVVGPRIGYFHPETGEKIGIQGHNLSMTTIGTLLLWFGWFGFNGGSAGVFNESIPLILTNTFLGGASGGMVLLAIGSYKKKYADIDGLITGILIGLVSITASCHAIQPSDAIIIGGLGGVVGNYSEILMHKLKVDDVFNVVVVHGFGGVWGTIAVALFADLTFLGTELDRFTLFSIQVLGTVVCFLFAGGFGYVSLKSIDKFFPLRVSEADEISGLNFVEHRATTEALELLTEMENHRRTSDFTQRVSANPHTQVGLVAMQYNAVLEKVVSEISVRSETEKQLNMSKLTAEMLTEELKISLEESEKLREETEDSNKKLSLAKFNADMLAEELKMSLDESEKLRIEAESANKMKSEFLANVGHELRTPMNAILGFSDLLDASVQTNAEKTYLKAIKSSGKGLLTLINDILELSKSEFGQLKINAQPINLSVFLEQLKNYFAPLCNEKGLYFSLHTQKKLPEIIIADEARLRQIFINIIGNAVKFTNSGSVEVEIDIDNVLSETATFIFIIKDSGIGIPAHEQQRIFEAFVQQNGDANRTYEGAGLGLALTNRIVESMQGQISVESYENVGSIFTVILPNIKINGDFQEIALDTKEEISLIVNSSIPVKEAEKTDIENKLVISKENYSAVELEKINTIVLQLQNELTTYWEDIRENQITNDISEFGSTLIKLSEEYKLEPLFEFGNTLKDQADTFQIDSMNVWLEKYPEVVRKISDALK